MMYLRSIFCPVSPVCRLRVGPALALLATLACALTFVDRAFAAGAGFRTLGIWDAEEQIRLDICVWYPVQGSASTARYGDWALRVNRRAKPIEGRFPLVVISHDTVGNRFAHHNLAASLAGQGFVVVAPTHSMDNFREMGRVFTEEQLTVRLSELRHTIDAVCSDSDIGQVIDTNRIGVLGFGSGGATALLAAGGRIHEQAWYEWRDAATPKAPYMHPWTRKRLDALAGSETLRRVQADPRIRAVVAAAPAYSMFFDKASLARVRVPVHLIAVEKDPVNPAPDFLSRLGASFPQPADMSFIPEADPYALLAMPEGRQTESMTDYAPPSARLHAQVFQELNREVSRFFMSTIGDPGLPPPPPPLPDDTIADELRAEEEPVLEIPAPTRRQR